MKLFQKITTVVILLTLLGFKIFGETQTLLFEITSDILIVFFFLGLGEIILVELAKQSASLFMKAIQLIKK